MELYQDLLLTIERDEMTPVNLLQPLRRLFWNMRAMPELVTKATCTSAGCSNEVLKALFLLYATPLAFQAN